MKTISVFGSTGSVGVNTLKYLEGLQDKWQIIAITAYDNVELLIKQALKFRPKYAAIVNDKHYKKLKFALSNTEIIVKSGLDSIIDVASYRCDIIVMAITGIAALKPLIKAIESRSNVALANKESIVCGGNLIINLAKQYGIKIIPVDSEHNAIFQLIQNQKYENIDKVYLTASGGPFRKYSKSNLEYVTVEQALKHPTWQMGKKISIDSATMMNKSLELIEAHYLFNLPVEKIDVIIHPESIIHAIVDFSDGNNFAALNQPDMLVPIIHALNYPERIKYNLKKLNFIELGSLNFEEIDYKKFNSIKIAKQCIRSSNKEIDCIIFNTANEVAVDNFLKEKIKFTDIIKIIEKSLNKQYNHRYNNVDDIYEIDQQVRSNAAKIIDDI